MFGHVHDSHKSMCLLEPKTCVYDFFCVEVSFSTASYVTRVITVQTFCTTAPHPKIWCSDRIPSPLIKRSFQTLYQHHCSDFKCVFHNPELQNIIGNTFFKTNIQNLLKSSFSLFHPSQKTN